MHTDNYVKVDGYCINVVTKDAKAVEEVTGDMTTNTDDVY